MYVGSGGVFLALIAIVTRALLSSKCHMCDIYPLSCKRMMGNVDMLNTYKYLSSLKRIYAAV